MHPKSFTFLSKLLGSHHSAWFFVGISKILFLVNIVFGLFLFARRDKSAYFFQVD